MPRPSHRAVPLPAGPVRSMGPALAALVPALFAAFIAVVDTGTLSGAAWVGILVWLGTAPVLIVTYRALSRPTLYVDHGGNADADASIEELFACRPTSTRPKHRT